MIIVELVVAAAAAAVAVVAVVAALGWPEDSPVFQSSPSGNYPVLSVYRGRQYS